MAKRWRVIVTYLPDHMSDDVFQVEELSELEEKIELGPDWNLIDVIKVKLVRQ